MNEHTRDFLVAARRHLTAATFLRSLADDEPTVREWVGVIAFYSAVHFINAYLWERQQIEPANHAERSRFVLFVREFRPIQDAYRSLRDIAYACRYSPQYRLTLDDVDICLTNLRAVEQLVEALLDRR
ncbi:MAG TPA: hypothetical protein VEX37_06495 [Thermomicrobiales bacterium]|nr:hypothetical protein [Thermomicrobiales bacterium]